MSHDKSYKANDRQIHELEDIAILTGGQLISEDSGRELKSIMVEEMGRADKFIADVDKPDYNNHIFVLYKFVGTKDFALFE